MKMMNLFLALALGAFGCSAWAQPAGYPNKPIQLVIGFAPGGAADIVARVMSDRAREGARPAGGGRQQAGRRLEHRCGASSPSLDRTATRC